MKIETTTTPIVVDPARSALVIIDMQNYFLSPAIGRQSGAGHRAADKLMQYAIPAARKAEMRVVWLNWGLTHEEINSMPPAITRAFGFEAECNGRTIAVDKQGNPRLSRENGSAENPENKAKLSGMGSWCGDVVDPDSGKMIDAGKLLMRDQWNTELFGPLDEMYREGRELKSRPDVLIHKNRMSGMWGSGTACEEFLEREGIKTLFFAGVNTDQCVGGTHQDSFNKGYDCILLTDGTGTTSPAYAQQCIEFNACNTLGFSTTCRALYDGAQTVSTQ